MLESSNSCRNAGYSCIVQSPEGFTTLALQLNYITEIVLELNDELAKIKAEVKEIKKQLALTHLSLVNEIRHNAKSDLGITSPYQGKYPFQNPKTKNHQKNHQEKNQKKDMDYKQYIILKNYKVCLIKNETQKN